VDRRSFNKGLLAGGFAATLSPGALLANFHKPATKVRADIPAITRGGEEVILPRKAVRTLHKNLRGGLLLPGNDPSAINLAYLVRYGVGIKKVEQLFADEIFDSGAQALFSRPPLHLEACYIENCLSLLNLHLRSMRGIDNAASGAQVRRKRLAQAEAIARWSNRLQNSKVGVSLLILGDLNALTPADEHVDIAGVIRGNPENRDRRLRGPDLVQPDLVDLSLLIPEKKRYSFVFRRRKQQLDYMLVNQAFADRVEYIAFSGIDSRFSDHAWLEAWFSW